MQTFLILVNFVKNKIMKYKALIIIVLLSFGVQFQNQKAITKDRYIGSSAFMLMNVFLTNDPEPSKFYMLDLGYRITSKYVVSLEVITWNYYEPIGSKDKADGPSDPGSAEAYGLGLTYKRLLWKGAFAKIHST